MKKLFILITFLLSACSDQSIGLANMGLIVSNENQKNIVWVNDEPVKVIEPNGYGVTPLMFTFKTGINHVYVTSLSEDGLKGATHATIKEGNWNKPNDIITHFEWESKKDKDRSPIFTYDVENGFKEDLSAYEQLKKPSDIEIRRAIKKVYSQIKEALHNRSLQNSGIDETKLETMMQSFFKVKNFKDKVFSSKTYSLETPSKLEDLQYVVGSKSILVYNPNGSKIFKAGPEETNNGEMVYSLILESLVIVKDDGKWKLAFF